VLGANPPLFLQCNAGFYASPVQLANVILSAAKALNQPVFMN
jgi:hypothetical protein